MPIIRLPCRGESPPSMPLAVSGHGITGKKKRVRARFAISVAENYLSEKVIRELGLFPHGRTELNNGTETDFYFIDLHFTVGMLGALTDRTTFRGVTVIPSPRLNGLIIGMDLIRRGRLTADAAGITFCF